MNPFETPPVTQSTVDPFGTPPSTQPPAVNAADFVNAFRSNIERFGAFLGTLPPNVLFVEPYHGLGNRLRAYASAAALAKMSGRALAVVWIPDVHQWARFSDLFQVPKEVVVFDHAVLPALKTVRGRILYYDYNKKGGKDEVLRDRSRAAIYVRSAYVLQSDTKVTEQDIIVELQSLKPAYVVRRRVT